MTEDTTSNQKFECNEQPAEPGAAGDGADAQKPPKPVQTAPALPPEIEKLQSQLDQLRRHAADLDNSRKRIQRDRERELADQQVSLLKGLLPVVDNVERALDSLQKATEPEAVKAGIEQILKIFTDYLARLGVKPIPSVGARYDANLHEAIAQMPSPLHDDGVIAAETERGYFLNERVLRHSRVVVSSGRSAPQVTDPAAEQSAGTEAAGPDAAGRASQSD